jgi:hypothetical protein
MFVITQMNHELVNQIENGYWDCIYIYIKHRGTFFFEYFGLSLSWKNLVCWCRSNDVVGRVNLNNLKDIV